MEEEATGKKGKKRHRPRPPADSTSVPVPKPSHPSCPARQDCALQNNDSDDNSGPQWTTCSVQGHLTCRVTPRGGRDHSRYRCSNGDTEKFNHLLGVTQPGFKPEDAWLAGQGTEPLPEKMAVARLEASAGPQQSLPALLPSPRPLLGAPVPPPAWAPTCLCPFLLLCTGSPRTGAFAG